jgi:hypothetical protein
VHQESLLLIHVGGHIRVQEIICDTTERRYQIRPVDVSRGERARKERNQTSTDFMRLLSK